MAHGAGVAAGIGAFLWTTRLVGWRTLVYLGLALLVAGTLDLSSWTAGWGNSALLAGWLAVTAALLGLALWSAGVAVRRFGLSGFYSEPCFHAAFALTVGVIHRGPRRRILGREAYRLGTAALGSNVIVTMLLARTWRTAELTYAAVFHLVTATYVVLFSVGNNDPRDGLRARPGRGDRGRRVLGHRVRLPARPRRLDERLRPAALSLEPLIDGAGDSPRRSFAGGSGSGGVSFLLTVKSLPRVEWLYGAVACLGGCMLLRLAGSALAHRADRVRDRRGLRPLGPGRVDPAAQAHGMPAAGIEAARL